MIQKTKLAAEERTDIDLLIKVLFLILSNVNPTKTDSLKQPIDMILALD